MLALLLDSRIRRGELLALRVVEGEVDPGRKRCLVPGKSSHLCPVFIRMCRGVQDQFEVLPDWFYPS